VNWVTQKPHRGINTLLLKPWKWLEAGDDETRETEKVQYLRYSNDLLDDVYLVIFCILFHKNYISQPK
jgi:hypothetical protein